jgi:hypothetical protein
MSDQDKDLTEILKPLQDLFPNDLQMQRWRSAVRGELQQSKFRLRNRRLKFVMQLAVATIFGFVVGISYMKIGGKNLGLEPESGMSATFEYSRANLD